MANINTRIVLCSKTEAEWQNNTTVILSGEIAISSDKRKIKIGDGSHYWSQLKYANYTPEEVDNLISSNIANLRSDLTGHISDNNKHFRNSEEKGQFISIKDGLDSGTAGTVLTKSSSGDYDFEWSTVPQVKATYNSTTGRIKFTQEGAFLSGGNNVNIPQKVTDLQDHNNYMTKNDVVTQIDNRFENVVFFTEDENADDLITAENIAVVDNDNNFNSDTVEGVLKELKTELETLRGGVDEVNEVNNIVCEKSGEVVSLDDSSNGKIQKLVIYGRSEQKTLSGKNLFGNIIHDGLFGNSDGIFAGGTGYKHVIINTANINALVFSNGDLTLLNSSVIRVFGSAEYPIAGGRNIRLSNISSKDNTCNCSDYNYILLGLNMNNESSFDVIQNTYQIEKGTVATDYEPYCGGVPSPNPEFPQEISSVGDSGEIKADVCGKNLSPLKESINNCNFPLNVKLKKGVTYVMSYDIDVSSGLNIFFRKTLNGANESEIAKKSSFPKGRINCKFTMPEDGYIFHNGYKNNTQITNIQLEVGSVGTPYAQYLEPYSTTLPLSEPLRGIPVESGGNVIIDGQQYVSDVLTVFADGRGEIERNIDSYVVTGRENWISNISNKFRCNTTKKRALKEVTLNNYFKYIRFNIMESAWVNDTHENTLEVCINTTKFDTIANLKEWLQDCYNTGNPMEFIYIPNESIVEQLTPNQVKEFLALHTYKPNTTITNSENTYQTISYIADAKTYIDNKFKELATTLVASSDTETIQENN